MKRKYIAPAIRMVECHPAKFITSSTDPTNATLNNEDVDGKTNPNPGARELDENDGISWWDEDE